MDYVLQAINDQWPGQGNVLSQALKRIGVDPYCHTREGRCRLTRSGSPVEFAFCWGDGLPRVTADPAPGEIPRVRLSARSNLRVRCQRLDWPRLLRP